MSAGSPGHPTVTLTRLAARQLARATAVWSSAFALLAVATVKGYEAAYPSASSRLAIAGLLARNPAFQAIYGVARGIDTTAGFTAWRVGGSLAVIAGAWGLLSASRLVRGEEDVGRAELLRAGAVTSAQVLGAALAAVVGALVVAGITLYLSLLWSGLPSTGSLSLSAAITLSGVTFAAVGAVTSELADTRRRAAGLAAVALGASFGARLVADGTSGLGWLRWCTPLGWSEEVRAFSGDRLGPMVLLVAFAGALTVASVVLQARRDLGAGALGTERPPPSRLVLLGSPLAFGIRSEIGTVLAWTGGVGAFAVLGGLVAKDVGQFISTSSGFQRVAERLAAGNMASAAGFLALLFTFLALPVALVVVFQVGAARTEESTGRLELVLAGAVHRVRWLAGRLAVAAAGATVVALASGALAWAAAAWRGAGIGLVGELGAGLNLLPATAVFLGITIAAFGLAPRATVPAGAGAVTAAYLLQLVGASARLPAWVLDLSPFHHVAAVPVAPFDTAAAVVMVLIGLGLAAVGIAGFSRRDLAPS